MVSIQIFKSNFQNGPAAHSSFKAIQIRFLLVMISCFMDWLPLGQMSFHELIKWVVVHVQFIINKTVPQQAHRQIGLLHGMTVWQIWITAGFYGSLMYQIES